MCCLVFTPRPSFKESFFYYSLTFLFSGTRTDETRREKGDIFYTNKRLLKEYEKRGYEHIGL